ncbi:MAG: hypothetical protein ABEH90_01865, partial [Halolamina sp.]
MVGSSIDADDRDQAALLFKIGFTLLVGVSAGLVSLQVNAGLEFVLAAVVVGTGIGAVLTWFVARELRR